MENTGQKLKTQRTALGLSIQKVADKTKVRANIIADLEENYTEQLETPYISAFTNTLQDFYRMAENNADYLQELKNEAVNNKKNITKKNKRNFDYETVSYNFESSDKFVNTDLDTYTKNDITGDSYVFATSQNESSESSQEKKEHITKETPTIYDFNSNKQQITRPSQKIKRSRSLATPKVYFANTLNITIKEIITYIALAMFLFLVVFFVFVYDENTFDFLKTPKMSVAMQDNNTNDSIPNIATNENDLFAYFKDTDSLVLRAVCHDTAWVKVELDGKKSEELLMLPNTDNTWNAWEKIVLATSNIGNISFYKNDTLLPKLGSAGTMVKNIVITRGGVSNVTPLTSGNNTVPINHLPADINTVNTTVSQNQRPVKTQKTSIAKKKKQDTKPITIIDFSKPNINKAPILEKQEEEE